MQKLNELAIYRIDALGHFHVRTRPRNEKASPISKATFNLTLRNPKRRQCCLLSSNDLFSCPGTRIFNTHTLRKKKGFDPKVQGTPMAGNSISSPPVLRNKACLSHLLENKGLRHWKRMGAKRYGSRQICSPTP